ncbi:MauE/DoxX family redox-associated membrane protein [Flavobacterium oreochromis]|uniref:MauE/DoxX family redox-associated membrane protein n=1 Tax=Flavobacterium oreochromis TaxID=2906078 RepID=A0ABW8P7C4_9FLAO|nr:MauE/DoxX family redox-associated membrane protein [Flavobacterium oreochromis]OWP75428.1 protein tlpB [Flavobacterium oreochromis]
MKKNLIILLRIIIALLFIVSAIAKMYPSPYFAISTFEVKQLYPLGFSETIAPWFSRTLIGIEMALGILILQNNYFKKIIIPSTIILLAIFIIHLSYETFINGGNSGNCGCFGELIPMTPIEAIIKNIVAIIILIILLSIFPKNNEETHKFWPISIISLASIIGIFILAPIKSESELSLPTDIQTDSTHTITIDSSFIKKDSIIYQKTNKDSVIKTTQKTEEEKIINEPIKKKSGYAQFFSKIDNGRKTLCFFVPGCDHCRQAAKELTELKRINKKFPEILVLFMNEEPEKIPDFFKETGAEYPYKIIEIIPFWKLLGTGKDTPGVKYLWNGNEYKYYFGINENQFNPKDYQELINKSFTQLNK